jgi:hypothetical protein
MPLYPLYSRGKGGFFGFFDPKKTPRNLRKSWNPKSKVVSSNILESYFQLL